MFSKFQIFRIITLEFFDEYKEERYLVLRIKISEKILAEENLKKNLALVWMKESSNTLGFSLK